MGEMTRWYSSPPQARAASGSNLEFVQDAANNFPIPGPKALWIATDHQPSDDTLLYVKVLLGQHQFSFVVISRILDMSLYGC